MEKVGIAVLFMRCVVFWLFVLQRLREARDAGEGAASTVMDVRGDAVVVEVLDEGVRVSLGEGGVLGGS
ncbi:pyridine nucleotide-disulfide oxidoreductase, partial [Pseudomonas syringae pv. tagetis]|uniref:hypothetical protein n=1 Tax=Pseudomonas syringae group genomosp. 7 TaxID=251699 RepID=UPI00376FA34B